MTDKVHKDMATREIVNPETGERTPLDAISREMAPNTKMENVLTKSRADGMAMTNGHLMPTNFADVVLFSDYMSRSQMAVPKHLRDNPGACLAVIMQASRWKMDPYGVAQKSYAVGDKISYEAQVIAAAILSSGVFAQRPDYSFEGEGEDRVCVINAMMSDGSTITHQSPKFKDITPKNSPVWKFDPDQQQGYYTIRAMARRHFPDLLLGVYDVEEANYAEARGEPKVINPEDNPLNDDESAPTIDATPEDPGMPSDVEP